MLVGFARTLVILDEVGGDTEMLHEAEVVQQTIARLHGSQRARIGWTAADVHREYATLRRVLADFVGSEAARDPHADAELMVGITNGLLERSERVTVESHAHAELRLSDQ